MLPQHAVPDAALGNLVQHLLHTLHNAPNLLAVRLVRLRSANVHAHGEQARKPSDRARHISSGHNVLASVALHRERHDAARRPLAQRPRERRHEHVVDLPAERRARVAQQAARRLLVNARVHKPAVAARKLHRARLLNANKVRRNASRRARPLGHAHPVHTLVARRQRRAVRNEAGRPRHERRRLGREHDRLLARKRLLQPAPEVLLQNPPRHAINGHVVHDNMQPLPVRLAINADQREPARRALGERNAPLLLVARTLNGLRRAAARRSRHVDDGEADRGRTKPLGSRGLNSLLNRPPVRAARQPHPKHVVLPNNGLANRKDLVRPGAPSHVQQQALVEVVAPLAVLQEPRLDRRQHDSARHVHLPPRDNRRLVGLAVAARLGHARQLGNRLVLKHVLDRDDDAGLAQARDGLDADDRVAAEIEEAVRGTKVGSTEKGSPSASNQTLDSLRINSFNRSRQRRLSGEQRRRRWKRLAVHLSCRRQRQRGHADKDAGNHVARKLLRERVLQNARVAHDSRLLAQPAVLKLVLVKDNVGNQLGRRARAFDDDNRVKDDIHALQDRLDLAKLDAEAADLHLEINPPNNLNPPAGKPAAEIARAIHARTAHAAAPASNVGYKRSRSEPRALVVAKRKLAATETELARQTDGKRAEEAVNDAPARVLNSAANAHDTVALLHFVPRHVDCRFRRAVQVEQAASTMLQQIERRVDKRPRQRLATAGHNEARHRPEAVARRRAKHGAKHRRHKVHNRRPQAQQEPVEKIDVLQDAGLGNGNACSVHRRLQKLKERDVERETRLQDIPRRRPETKIFHHPVQAVGKAADLVQNALRDARRARGVDHVRRPQAEIATNETPGRRSIAVVEAPRVERSQTGRLRCTPGNRVTEAKNNVGLAVADRKLNACRRKTDVKGHVDSAH